VVPFAAAREGVAVRTREDGQAAVELVALLPWVAAVLAVAWQFVLAGDARSSAAVAARAAARAAAVGADPAAAARAHLPRRLERGLRVRAREGGAVSVSVRVPAVAGPLKLGRVAAEASLGAAP
jgi:pilus assembly protein CpaE